MHAPYISVSSHNHTYISSPVSFPRCWIRIVSTSFPSFDVKYLIIMSILRQRFYSPLVGPPGVPQTDLLPKWLYCNGLIALQWSRRMLQFTAKVSPIHHLVSTALNHRKQPLISGQWAESLHFWALLSASRKWLILLVPEVLWVLQTSDFKARGQTTVTLHVKNKVV